MGASIVMGSRNKTLAHHAGSRVRAYRRVHHWGLMAHAVAFTAMVTLTTSAHAAVDRHILFQAATASEGCCSLWVANSDGSDPRKAGISYAPHPALAPDGRSVAYGSQTELDIKDIGGGTARRVYQAANHWITSPRYSPDGTKLIFDNHEETGSNDTIDVIDVDGSGHSVLEPHATPYFSAPDFSPDGTKIAFSAYAEPGNWRSAEIYIANANGSEPTAVTRSTEVQYAIHPRFSPDGKKIAFTGTVPGTFDEEVYTVNVDGSGLTRLTSDEYTAKPEWTPTGTRIVFERETLEGMQLESIKSDGTGGEEPFEETTRFTQTSEVTFSPAGSTVTADDYLGMTFEPILRFHSTEKWRPLNVASFMLEEEPGNPGHSYNKICVEGTCSDIGANWEEALRRATETPGTRDIKMGEWPEHKYAYPTSPVEECYAGELWDCNSGPRTAIYYHVVPSATEGKTTELGYNYVDYWIFYRYNRDENDPLALDDHQGDWEGLTVAPSQTDPGAFDFAIFAQHKEFSVYAPENLQCDQGGSASCVSEGQNRGTRVWDFVAVGTHASYPAVDEGGTSGICTQAKKELPEGCHDGKAPWGANYEASDAIPFPGTGGGYWTDWPGTWGDDPGGLLEGTGESPRSPGLQSRFKCPWKPYAPDTTACPSRVIANPARAREAIASTCGNWFGAMIAVTACSPSELRHAVHDATMGRRGDLRIIGRRRHAAALPGVSQILGPPLRAGERLVVEGRAPSDTQLFIRAEDHGMMMDDVIKHLGLRTGGRGTISASATRHGLRVRWTAPGGRREFPTTIRVGRIAGARARG